MPARSSSRRARTARSRPAAAPRAPREALGFYGYRVRDVMTRPVVTIGSRATLAEAATRMTRGRISGAPVLSPSGRLVGVISHQDILRVLSEKAGFRWPAGVLELLLGRPTPGRTDLASQGRHLLETVRVSEVMSRPAKSVGPEVSLDDAVRILVANRINRLPVVDRGRLLGIVTRTDLLSGLTTSSGPS